MKIELLSIPNCPHVGRARELLHSCIDDLGIDLDVEERHAVYPSPSILVDGVDVMGNPGYRTASCRLDIPTRLAILKALKAT